MSYHSMHDFTHRAQVCRRKDAFACLDAAAMWRALAIEAYGRVDGATCVYIDRAKDALALARGYGNAASRLGWRLP